GGAVAVTWAFEWALQATPRPSEVSLDQLLARRQRATVEAKPRSHQSGRVVADPGTPGTPLRVPWPCGPSRPAELPMTWKRPVQVLVTKLALAARSRSIPDGKALPVSGSYCCCLRRRGCRGRP